MTDTGDHHSLLGSFEEQLTRTARFVRAAFHVHSIASHDWGRDGDATLNAKERFAGEAGQAEFLNALAHAGLEVVCITDHMKSAYACELALLAAARDDIAVFPGVEVSALIAPAHADRIHLLAIFPPGTSADMIERIFHGVPGEADRDGEEQIDIASLAEWRGKVEGEGGMLILAHLDQQRRGHRSYVRGIHGEAVRMVSVDPNGAETVREISDLYAEYLVDVAPDAVEVRRSEDRRNYLEFQTANGRHHGVACVAQSDHHRLEDLGRPEAITHLKVSKLDFDRVKEALRFQDTRVRFSDQLPDSPMPRLLGLRLHSPEGGLFADATLAFNENLNCLIGPRGCGKSTVVEALRYVLGQGEVGDGAGADAEYAALAGRIRRANLVDTQIEVIYEKAGERFVLSAAFEPDVGCTSRVFTLDGGDCQVGTEAIAGEFPARIFSWSELETMGRDPRLQRSVIDRLVPGLAELYARAAALQAAVAENREQILRRRADLGRLLERDGAALGRYTEFRLAFERMNTPEVAALFAELDAVRERLSALEELDSELEALLGRIEQLDVASIESSVSERLGTVDGLADWWAQEMADLDLGALTSASRAAITELRRETEIRRALLAAKIEEAREHRRRTDENLRERTQADPDASLRREHREQARARHEGASAIRTEYLATFEELRSDLAERGRLLAEQVAVREEIGRARGEVAGGLSAQLEGLAAPGPQVTVEVDPGADREGLIDYLDGSFLNLERGGRFHASGLAASLAGELPVALAWALLAGEPAILIGRGGEERPSEAQAKRLVESFEGVFSRSEQAEVPMVDERLDDLLELQEQQVDDVVRILAQGRPVDKLSPGGRSSAMLPLIALSDTVPLIIDQPEDNLDNRMVGKTLSSILARLKEHRQIIVTTHNPNIVVGGDAEQVVVLRATGAHSARVESTGNIDDPAIVESVIAIMEGGREAFDERRRRYEPLLRG